MAKLDKKPLYICAMPTGTLISRSLSWVYSHDEWMPIDNDEAKKLSLKNAARNSYLSSDIVTANRCMAEATVLAPKALKSRDKSE